jgi:hypothetical protein
MCVGGELCERLLRAHHLENRWRSRKSSQEITRLSPVRLLKAKDTETCSYKPFQNIYVTLFAGEDHVISSALIFSQPYYAACDYDALPCSLPYSVFAALYTVSFTLSDLMPLSICTALLGPRYTDLGSSLVTQCVQPYSIPCGYALPYPLPHPLPYSLP